VRIVVIGAGHVGRPLADGWAAAGHDVVVAPRGQELATLPGAEVVVLAVPFPALADLLPPLADALAGTVVIDCTNPVGPGLSHGLGSTTSGTQQVQALLPDARVAKAFSIYGWENLADNRFPGPAAPLMMIAADDAGAAQAASRLAAELGWDPLVVGGLEQALHLEHLTLLWIRMVRAGGRDPHIVWARLERGAHGRTGTGG
jgi:predicted dinucleotide-binding enzyme